MANDKKAKKLGSTARNLHNMWIGRLIVLFTLLNIAAAASIILFTMFYMHKASFGNNWPETYKSVDYNDADRVFVYKVNISSEAKKKYSDNIDGYSLEINIEDWRAIYTVYSGGAKNEQDLTYAFLVLRGAGTLIICFEVLYLLNYIIRGQAPIRKKLRPLNEITEDAFKISTMPFDESRIHDLETAISRITPDGSEGRLVTNDSELKGLEAAINAMIDRIRASYEQQARFVSDASHELRTPIAVIKGYADMLDRWGKDDEKILEESITAIRNESAHMNELVEQLLFLARGDSGRQPLNMQDISLYDILKEVYEESLMIDEKHIYEFKGAEDVIVCADAAMLKQTIRILVDNAAKYTHEKERITIGCSYNSDGRATFYVQDNGMGMSEHDVAHVFERFYRADNARYGSSQGSGLGLSIAKWIIDRHGGHFEVLSREDIGTRITVVL